MDIRGEAPHKVQSQAVGWNPGDFCCGTKRSEDAGQGDTMGVGWGEGRALASMNDNRQVPHPIWEDAGLLRVDRLSPPSS